MEPGPHLPTPRAMAAAQVVRQPIRRVVSFGSLTGGGCLTPERPQIPVGESHRASGCTAPSQPGAPPTRGSVVGLYSAVWSVPARKPWAASQELLLPVCVPAVDPRECTGTTRYRCSYRRSGPEPTGSNDAPAPSCLLEPSPRFLAPLPLHGVSNKTSEILGRMSIHHEALEYLQRQVDETDQPRKRITWPLGLPAPSFGAERRIHTGRFSGRRASSPARLHRMVARPSTQRCGVMPSRASSFRKSSTEPCDGSTKSRPKTPAVPSRTNPLQAEPPRSAGS